MKHLICGNWLGKGQLRASARTGSSGLAARTTTSRDTRGGNLPHRVSRPMEMRAPVPGSSRGECRAAGV